MRFLLIFREACSSGDFKLSNVVEVDETYVGGKVTAKPISGTDSRSVIEFVKAHTEPGATVYTDDAKAYAGLQKQYQHGSVKHSVGEFVRGEIHTNSIESFWAVFKRSIHGTWHHVSNKHLARYVNEATFRLNEGNCEVDTIDRMTALVKRVGGKRLPYKELVA